MKKYPGENTIGSAWRWFINSISGKYSGEEARAAANEIFSFLFSLTPAQRVLQRDTRISESSLNSLYKIIEKLLQHVPVEYITGRSSFLDLELKVNEHVLIPRPETEELVVWIEQSLKEKGGVQEKSPLKILDIGTGSGCIAIAVARLFPQARVMACDIDPVALELARENALRNNVTIEAFSCDILKEVPLSYFDVIVSNPPYVREKEKSLMKPNVLLHEPPSALFVGDSDPLIFYREIALKAKTLLPEGGFLFFEINEFLGKETARLIEDTGFNEVIIKKDINGKDRMIRATFQKEAKEKG